MNLKKVLEIIREMVEASASLAAEYDKRMKEIKRLEGLGNKIYSFQEDELKKHRDLVPILENAIDALDAAMRFFECGTVEFKEEEDHE